MWSRSVSSARNKTSGCLNPYTASFLCFLLFCSGFWKVWSLWNPTCCSKFLAPGCPDNVRSPWIPPWTQLHCVESDEIMYEWGTAEHCDRDTLYTVRTSVASDNACCTLSINNSKPGGVRGCTLQGVLILSRGSSLALTFAKTIGVFQFFFVLTFHMYVVKSRKNSLV